MKISASKTKIAILDLNPHAGDGSFAIEEIEIIEPAIKELFNEGILALALSLQTASSNQRNTVHLMLFLAMHHDQGLAPSKH